MISIVMVFRIRAPEFNSLWEITSQAINGIIQTADEEFELILIDNGSHDDRYVNSLNASAKLWEYMPYFRKSLLGTRVFRFDEPTSLAKAWNVGVHQADGDYIMLANNDIVFHETGWMSRMLEPFSWEDRKIGIVGIQHMSWRFFAFTEFSLVVFPAKFKQEFNIDPNAVGRTMILDEQFTLSCEDVDLCRRVQDAGYETIQVDNPAIQPRWLQHLGHRTVNTLAGTDESYVEFTHENRKRLCRKYGYPEEIND